MNRELEKRQPVVSHPRYGSVGFSVRDNRDLGVERLGRSKNSLNIQNQISRVEIWMETRRGGNEGSDSQLVEREC